MTGDKKNLLGVLVSAVDYDGAVSQVIAAASEKRPFIVSAVAVHGVMAGVLDLPQRYRLNQFDLLVPDGQPVRWAMNMLHGTGLRDRVYGPELMLRICEQAARQNLPIFLYGSRENVSEQLAKRLQQRFPSLRIAGREASKFRRLSSEERESLAGRIVASGARIVFVGLGCPRQEIWAYENRKRLPLAVVAVGAAFDFHAGFRAQAPGTMQRMGLEWLFRLSQEPMRLWRRYLLLNPLFAMLVVGQLTHLRTNKPADATEPGEEVGFG